MYLSDDAYRGMKAAEFEADAPDPFEPLKAASQWATKAAASWQPAKWLNDAASFAERNAKPVWENSTLGRVTQGGGGTPTEYLERAQRGDVARDVVSTTRETLGAVNEGIGSFGKEVFRSGPLGQSLMPYSAEEAYENLKMDPGAEPIGRLSGSQSLEETRGRFRGPSLTEQYEQRGPGFDEDAWLKQARTGVVGSNLVIGASDPLRVGKLGRVAGRAAAEAEMQAALTRNVQADYSSGIVKTLQPKQTAALEAAGAGTTPPPRPPAPPSRGLPPGGDVPPGGNRGSEINDILDRMYSERGKVEISVPDRLRAARNAFVRSWTDRGTDLAQFQQRVAKEIGRPLEWNEMADELRRLNPTKAAEVRLQESLSPALQGIGADLPELSKYLTLRQDMSIVDALGNPDRAFPGGYKGTDVQPAIQDLAARLGPERFERLETTAGKVHDFMQGELQRKRDAGIITDELFTELSERYPYYVPTRILDYINDPSRVASGGKISLSDDGIRRYTFEGTERFREDPLASVVRYAYETEGAIRRNQTFNAFVNLVNLSPEAGRMVHRAPDNFKPTNKEALLHGFRDGVRETYVVPKDIEAVISNPSVPPIPYIGPALNAVMGVFRAGATSRNPMFLSANALNDMRVYAVREATRAGGPAKLGEVMGELITAYGDAFQGISTGTYSGATKRFLKEGGGMFGYFQGAEGMPKATVRELARRNPIQIRDLNDLKGIVHDLLTLKPVEAIGERIELAPRVAAMRLAEKRGENMVDAVMKGRTVTIDFQQGGTMAKAINQFIPFFNVGLQGAVQPVRAFKENPRAFIASAGAVIAAPTIAAEAWNNSDEQRKTDYEDVPDYIKNMGTVMMLPGKAPVDDQGNRRPQFLYIPLREFAPIANFTREVVRGAIGEDTQTWQELAWGGIEASSPIGMSSPAEAFGSMTVPGVGTGIELGANRDFFRNRNIASDYADETASAGSKLLAEKTGVGRPSQWEFGIRDTLTGVGGMALGASDLLAGERKHGGLSEAPFVGGMASRFVKGNIGQGLQDARDNRIADDVRGVLKEYKVDYEPGQVMGTIKGVKLTVAETERYQVLANQYVDEVVREALSDDYWREAPAEEKREVLETLVNRAKEYARGEVLEGLEVDEIERRLAPATSP